MEIEFTFYVYDSYFCKDNFAMLQKILGRCLIYVTDVNKVKQVNPLEVGITDGAERVQIKARLKEEHVNGKSFSVFQVYDFFIREWFNKASLYYRRTYNYLNAFQIPWLVIDTMNAFQTTQKASNENIFVSRFQMGTLVRSTQFVAHFHCESYLNSKIEANFFHDTRLVHIEFGKMLLLVFRYNNIRQILVQKNDKCTVLYFLLINPPTAFEYVEETTKGHKSFVKKRCSTYFGLDTDVIGKSNIYSLMIPGNLECEDILSRLFVRTGNTPIAFVLMESFAEKPPLTEININLSSFNCTYLLNAIFKRNYVILLQMDQADYSNFLSEINIMCQNNSHVLYHTLVDVLRSLDEGLIVEYKPAIIKLYSEILKQKVKEDENNRYLVPPRTKKVWRLIITPTRQLYFPAEISFENRVIRKYNGEFTLRVSFRDDDYGKLNNVASQCNTDFIRNIVIQPLHSGISIGDRKFEFLGWSNSQLRDHGVYMYAADDRNNTANSIRSWLGNFSEIRSVSKLMARMGQCFSHSEETVAVPFESSRIATESDVTSGTNPVNNKPYTFSEGVGRISVKLLTEVSEVLGFEYVPSAIQFRYAGYKGMLTMDPSLTDRDIVFRESQKKFTCRNALPRLEVVSKSSPIPVLLNRQLVTILDQKGVPPAVFLQLQQNMLKYLTEMLLDDDKAAEYLLFHSALPKINYVDLKAVGLSLNNDPFFRNMLLAQHRVAIDGIKRKARLEIEPNKGRNMFGVMDETGKLEYGQVFVQYTARIQGFESNRETVILKGDVLVTKNPCLQLGDVRKLKAVDIKELHHIIDCIVFPSKGKRPHPNEMGGSDLDGDEFTVIWKKELLFRSGNNHASNFPIPGESSQHESVSVHDMLIFLAHYITNDQVGVIGNAHLARADDVNCGLTHPLCYTLAQKFCAAVDFAKNGQNVHLVASEKPRMYPDFMEKGILANTYRSRRVLGKLYRVCKDYEVENISSVKTKTKTEVDPSLVYPGWETYREKAEFSRTKYKKLLSMLLNTYGIEDEFQVCGKAYITIHARAERKEILDIEELMTRSIRHLWKSFEEEFLDEFYGVDRVLETLAEEMLKKASAWYCVTYSDPNQKFLSFPWICWKYLLNIKRLHSQEKAWPYINPFVERLNEKLLTAVQHNVLPILTQEMINRCFTFVEFHNKSVNEMISKNILLMENVLLALQIVLNWALSINAVDFKLKNKKSGNNDYQTPTSCFIFFFLESIKTLQIDRPPKCMDIVLSFLKFCTALRFVTKENSFTPKHLVKKPKFLGKNAMSSFHSLAVSGSLSSIGLVSPGIDKGNAQESEMEPIKIEKENLQPYLDLGVVSLKNRLLNSFGASAVFIRDIGRYCLISAVGSKSSLKAIEKFLHKLSKPK